MKRRVFSLFLAIFYCLSLTIGNYSASASGSMDYIDSISVYKKHILTSDIQTLNIGTTGFFEVQTIAATYKQPDGSYSQIQMSRRSSNLMEGSTQIYKAGDWTLKSLIVSYRSGNVRYYEDISEGGSYELDGGNFTAHESDTAGPLFQGISVDKFSISPGESVTVTVQAEDEISTISSARIDYKFPDNTYTQISGTIIGNNQIQFIIPYYFTLGSHGYGKFECTGITLTDTLNNSTDLYDLSYYSTANLDGGDFILKAENNPPELNNITIENKEIKGGTSNKLKAEVTDASGVAKVNALLTSPFGTSHTVSLVHSFDNIYEGEIPGYLTYDYPGQWQVSLLWVEDIYENGRYIYNSALYPYGDHDFSGADFYVQEPDRTAPAAPTVNDLTDNSTLLYGLAEPYSTVQAKVLGTVIGSDTADQDGHYEIRVPLQLAKTPIHVTATDESGNESAPTVIYVRDVTPPASPEVSAIYDNTKIVTGYGEPYSKVEIYKEQLLLGSSTTNEQGVFHVNIPAQQAGSEVIVHVYDEAGNRAEPYHVIVKDGTAPAVPVVQEVTDQTTVITGNAEAFSTITIQVDGSIIATGSADANGQFSIKMPVQKAGTELMIYAKDDAGNVSESLRVIVKDMIAPDIPIVDPVTDQSTSITGQSEPHSTLTVMAAEKVIGSGKSDENGYFSIPISSQQAGTPLSITATDTNGNSSTAVSILVSDATAPEIPSIDEVSDKTSIVTGRAEPLATAVVTIGSKVYQDTVDNKGSFKVSIPLQKAGALLYVKTMDAAGNSSKALKVTVLDKTVPKAPIVDSVSNLMKAITGKAEANSTVTVLIGTKKYTNKANSNGAFTITIPTQKAGTKLQVTAQDSAGNKSVAATVTVLDKIAPPAPKVKAVYAKDKSVKGSAEAGSTITIKVGKKVIGTAKVTSKGTFTVTIKQQKKGTTLTITAADAAKNVSKPTIIKVK